MVHLLGEDEGVAVVGQMMSWGRVDLLGVDEGLAVVVADVSTMVDLSLRS